LLYAASAPVRKTTGPRSVGSAGYDRRTRSSDCDAVAMTETQPLKVFALIWLLAVAIITGSVAEANASPWWPSSDLAAAGAYCGGSKGNSRDGPVSVPVQKEGLAVDLDARRQRYRPGDTVLARVENIGSEPVLDSPEYQVDRFIRHRWKRVGPKAYGWPRQPSPLLSSGRARCFAFSVPESAAAGRYRVLKAIEHSAEGDRSALVLSLGFRVVLRGP
jgi:hypothetical protein